MADKIPLKAIYTDTDPTSLGEFQSGDTIPVSNGGTGATNSTTAKANLGLGNVLNEQQLTVSQLVTNVSSEDGKVPSAGAVSRYAASISDYNFLRANYLINNF